MVCLGQGCPLPCRCTSSTSSYNSCQEAAALQVACSGGNMVEQMGSNDRVAEVDPNPLPSAVTLCLEGKKPASLHYEACQLVP